jgi:Ca-activated chloride channel family protein
VDFPERSRENAFIARLWATQRVGFLAAELRRSGSAGGEQSELVAEIRELGERYGIPTQYSSYLVLEPGMTANAPMESRLRRVETSAPQLQQQRTQDFDAAKTAAAQRDASSLAQADSIALSAVPAPTHPTVGVGGAVGGGVGATAGPRRAGNHVYALRDGIWTDLAFRAELRVVKVKAYSDAYFELLTALPELRAPFALGDRVIAAGRRVAVEVGPDGAERLTAAELDRLRAEW